MTVVYCGGPVCSGTRMLYDIVHELGLEVEHVSYPGYHDNPNRAKSGIQFDTANPVWWTVEEVEARHPGDEIKWVLISRQPKYAGRCAISKHFVKNAQEYRSFRRREDNALNEIEGAYRIVYEEFVADPQGEYDKLADWLGVPHKPIYGIYDANEKYSKPEEG